MDKKNVYRVGIYLRLSDEDRDKIDKLDDSESIKNQRNLLLEEISKRDDFVLVDEYCDEDLSGAGTYRPEFERLIKDCENRKLDVVLVKSQSRFSRDMEIIEKYIHNKFIEWNIRFIGVSDNADTDNMGNKKSRQINGLVNEWYLEDVSNNIRSAFKAKMKQGEYISPFASFGYKIDNRDNNKLVIDGEASMVVKDIFNLYLSGMGFMGIAKYLNDNNIPSPSLYKYRKGIKLNIVSNKKREDIKWSSSAVKSILTNEVYLGHLIQGKRTTISYKNHKIKNKNKDEWIRCENTHDPIIDKDIFDKVQMVIKERTRVIKNSDRVHIFSGKVFCLECGKCMRKKNNNRYQYLVCYNDNCSNKDSIRYDVLEKIILDKINDKIREFYDKDMIEKERSKYCNFNDKIIFLEKRKVELNDKLIKNNNYLRCLYEDRVNGVITVEQFESLIKNYELYEEDYKKQMCLIDKEISSYKEDDYMDFNGYRGFSELNRFIILEFIDRICIGKIKKDMLCRSIEIRWNF